MNSTWFLVLRLIAVGLTVYAGNVLATVLELRGECILHASCVHVGGSTVAVVGDSGMGKSTVAALFCAEGAQLVSDDALRIDCADGNPICYRGTGQIRLRPAAARYAGSRGTSSSTPTAARCRPPRSDLRSPAAAW